MDKKTKQGLLAGGLILSIATIVLLTRRTIPKGAEAVKPFDVKQYLGKWFEIARLDYRFEKNLNNTTAQYSLNHDGTISVVNRGYDFQKKVWKQAKGKGKFVHADDEGKLKVSFFGPFYSGYNVIAVDKDYKYALVAGKNLNYLWILSRTTTIPEEIKEGFVQKARAIGYDTRKLVWVEHDFTMAEAPV